MRYHKKDLDQGSYRKMEERSGAERKQRKKHKHIEYKLKLNFVVLVCPK